MPVDLPALTLEGFWAPLCVAFIAVLLALFACCLYEVGRRDPELEMPRRILLGSAAATTALAWLVDPTVIPIEWITALQESGTHGHVRQLEGTYGHAGVLYWAFLHVFAGDMYLPRLRPVVAMNVWLAVQSTLLFCGVTLHIFRKWAPALGMTAVYAASRLTVNAALAETAGMFVSTLFLIGVVGVYVAVGERRRHWGLALVAWTVLIASLVRPETAGYGLVALAFITPDPSGLRARLLRWVSSLSVQMRSATATSLVIGLWLFGDNVPDARQIGHIGWLVDGLGQAPTYLSRIPFRLAFGGIPIIFSAVAIVGVVRCSRDMSRHAGLPISTAVLCCIYMSSSHGDAYEMIRKGSMIAPPILLLCCFGWLEARDLPRKAVVIGLGALCIASVVTFPFSDRYLLDRNQQREVRALVHIAHEHPDCVVAVPMISGWGPHRGGWQMGFIVDGLPFFVDQSSPETWETDGAQYLADADCVLVYRGLDCNTAGHCERWTTAAPVVWERTWESAPYTTHMGDQGAEIRLSAVRLYPARTDPQ